MGLSTQGTVISLTSYHVMGIHGLSLSHAPFV